MPSPVTTERFSLGLTPSRGALALLLIGLGGCASGEVEPPPQGEPLDLLQPPSGSLTGYEPLLIDVSGVDASASEVESVRVGGVLAIDLEPQDDGRLQVLLQGAPEPGNARVVLTVGGEERTLPQRYTYAAPLDPRFERVVAFGASLTQGVQDATPTHDGVMYSPALQTARALGAYMPQPVLVDPLFPTLDLASVGPAPDCEPTPATSFIRDSITDVLGKLVVEDEGFAYWVGRSDPDLVVRNLAAGGFRVDDMLFGPEVSEVVQNFLGPLSFDPYTEFAAGPRWSMIDEVERLEPTLVMSFDFMGNDVLSGTDYSVMEANVPPLVERLAATGAEVFLADMPDPGVLHGSVNEDPLGDAERTLALQCNALLEGEAAKYDNVHVVSVFDRTEELATLGLSLAGQELTTDMLGGLLSFDGLHFSPTGYAVTADLFVEEIGRVLGVELPAVDVEAVLEQDIHGPAAVRAAGREPEECRGGG